MPKTKTLTAKQRNALKYIQKAIMGEMTMQKALEKAGYSKETARQQKSVVDSLRNNSEMQKALDNAKIDESLIAGKLKEGLDAKQKQIMFQFLKLAAELRDAFPAKKQITAEVGVEVMLDEADGEADYAEWEKE